ncbi:MAG: hypothetical protein AABX02_01540 [archaeon]
MDHFSDRNDIQMHLPTLASLPKLIDSVVVILATMIIVDTWSGYAGILSPAMTIIALVAGYFIATTMNHHHALVTETYSHFTTLVMVFVILVTGLVLFGLGQGYDLSADVAPIFTAHQITNHIPLSYSPILDLPFFYPPGVPAVISTLDFHPIATHQWAWAAGLMGILLMITFLPRIGKTIGLSATALMMIPLLFLGARLPFLSLLTGEYPLLMSLGLGLAAWHWFATRPLLAGAVLGAATLAHPYGALSMAIGIIFTHPAIWKHWKSLLVTLIVALPPIVFQFIPYLQLEKSPSLESFHLGVGDLTATVMLVGLVPILVWITGTIFRLIKKEKLVQPELRYPFILLAVGISGYVIGLIFPSFVFGPKLLVLASLGAILGAAHECGRWFTPTTWKIGAGLVVVLCLSVAFTSPNLVHLAHGSKATLDEAQFANSLQGKIPFNTRVLFLSPGQGKMGEYSNTIPPDIFSTHFVNSFIWRTTNVESVISLRDRADHFWIVLKEKCVPCVGEFDEPFIVVNTRVFPALTRYPVLYEDNGFILYENSPSN